MFDKITKMLPLHDNLYLVASSVANYKVLSKLPAAPLFKLGNKFL